ncbi:MAG: AgmX/PglI C-terminal domain-containing protein [Bacteriovorax sp.]|nr:AgmX/PglI C-terminal domain-containing protein [Bacteriovorax sp.]
MSAIKKPLYVAGESKLEEETKRFNKRALIGSIVIHLFFFLLKLPHLVLEHKMHDDPKLEPIKMEFITPAVKNAMIQKKLVAVESEKIKAPAEDKKVKNGTEKIVKNSKSLGDPLKNKVQAVQKGDPRSQKKTAYDPKTDLRKLPKTDVGTGSAPGKVPSKDGNTGGSGDTYKGADMTNLTNSIMKSGSGLKRIKTNPNAIDDGGAGGGHGGGMGDGVGGGSGDGHFTGTTTGTSNMARVATNVGSLTGSAKGRIDSSKGFDGLATKGSVMVAGVPVEKIAVSTIDPDAIRRLLRDHIPQFRYCYQKELDVDKNPEGFQGVMNFRFFIASQGRVNRSEITSEEITSDKVRDCMKNVLHGIQFPAPHGGRTVEVNQPMNLYPKRM